MSWSRTRRCGVRRLALCVLAPSPSYTQHLVKSAAPHFDKAKKFYSAVAQELVAHGHAFDVFACALDQVRGGGTWGREQGREGRW